MPLFPVSALVSSFLEGVPFRATYQFLVGARLFPKKQQHWRSDLKGPVLARFESGARAECASGKGTRGAVGGSASRANETKRERL